MSIMRFLCLGLIQELRVTQIFRIEEGRWRIVHRHADSQVTKSTTR